MNIEFSKRTAIVTGAAHGFGRAIALGFAARGAAVWACDIAADELAETKRMAGAPAAPFETGKVDVSNREEVRAFVAAALKATGRIDILVNDAGGVLGQVGQPLEAVTPQQWQSIFDVNVTGAWHMCQAAA